MPRASLATSRECKLRIGRVTWVIVLAELEEVHRFETRAGSIQPLLDHEGRPSGARAAHSVGRCF
jgi:hypothetical protein